MKELYRRIKFFYLTGLSCCGKCSKLKVYVKEEGFVKIKEGWMKILPRF